MASAEASESPLDESTSSYHCPVASHSSPFLPSSTAYCVCHSLVLILVVKILGGGGTTSSELWQALVLETTSSSRKTHTPSTSDWLGGV